MIAVPGWTPIAMALVCAVLSALLASEQSIIVLLMARWPGMNVPRRRLLRLLWSILSVTWAALALVWTLVLVRVL